MLQSYCPNSVIILLSFLWLQSVLQSSKQTLELWSYGDQFSIIRSIRAYNHYLSVLSSLLHSRLSVVTQRSFHWKQLCSRLLFKWCENNFLWCRATLLRLLQSNQVKSTPRDYINGSIIPKFNLLVVSNNVIIFEMFESNFDCWLDFANKGSSLYGKLKQESFSTWRRTWRERWVRSSDVGNLFQMLSLRTFLGFYIT